MLRKNGRPTRTNVLERLQHVESPTRPRVCPKLPFGTVEEAGFLVDLLLGAVVLVAVAAAFFVSAAAGLGGSLILVPALALVLGTKEGVALAALLLATNNVVKVIAYRRVIPLRASTGIVALTFLGAYVGARLLVAAPAALVTAAVIVSFGMALVAERRRRAVRGKVMPGSLAFASGATSGFSGTSGPLKGIAIRSLALDRLHTVGAAALVSLVGDATKAAVFTDAALLGRSSYALSLVALPIMVLATYAGRRFNCVIGEEGYRRLFWTVMGGYTARLLVTIV